MKLSLYNTLSRKTEIFKPINPKLVKLYVCGPTVYDRAHIGNARSVVVYDLLFKLLKYLFGKDNVQYVRNITDVDDKIINRAKERNVSIHALTKETINFFHEDMDYLNAELPSHEPKATEHIGGMIEIIELLLKNHVAYISSNHVYFEVRKANEYTKLSGRTFDDMINEVRIDSSPGKKHPEDFVLWKPAEDTSDLDSNFNSPWGVGRPGWHIECSAMSRKFFGENFDIHGGGADLIFPHHTNEIAQTTSAFPESDFAHYWVHNGFLTVNRQKMSKSLNNFITVENLRNDNINGEVARFFLLSVHYRKPLDYNEKAFNDAHKTLNYLKRAVKAVEKNESSISYALLPNDFLLALCDDLNVAKAIACLLELAKKINSTNDLEYKKALASTLLSSLHFLGFREFETEKADDEKYIKQLIEKRNLAKKEKNWSLADSIRNQLAKEGIILEDTADGKTKWQKK